MQLIQNIIAFSILVLIVVTLSISDFSNDSHTAPLERAKNRIDSIDTLLKRSFTDEDKTNQYILVFLDANLLLSSENASNELIEAIQFTNVAEHCAAYFEDGKIYYFERNHIIILYHLLCRSFDPRD